MESISSVGASLGGSRLLELFDGGPLTSGIPIDARLFATAMCQTDGIENSEKIHHVLSLSIEARVITCSAASLSRAQASKFGGKVGKRVP